MKKESSKITEDEICKLLEISRSTLWRWRTKKGFPFDRNKLDGKVSYDLKKIIDWKTEKLHALIIRIKNTPNLGKFLND